MLVRMYMQKIYRDCTLQVGYKKRINLLLSTVYYIGEVFARYYNRVYGPWGNKFSTRMQHKSNMGMITLYRLTKKSAKKKAEETMFNFMRSYIPRMAFKQRI